MNSLFWVLFLLGSIFSQGLLAQSVIEDDLHEKVFGKKKEIRKSLVDVYSDNQNLGVVEARIRGDELISIRRDSLVEVLRNKLEQTEIIKISELKDDWIQLSDVSFPLKFSPEILGIIAKIPLTSLIPEYRELRQIEENKRQAIYPAPVGGAVTLRGEQFWADEKIGGNYSLAGFDSFLNVNGYVLENQTVYQSNVKESWFRGDTRLVKDFNDKMIRTQLGDVNYQTVGFQTLRPIGGFSFSKNFTLNPYRTPYPKFNRDFIVKTRSRVTYFVNGNLIKSEFLPPGRYSVRDVPLVNGINNIAVEIEDDLGRKEIVNFQQTTSINLLNDGESRFDISVGYPFKDINFKRKYEEDDLLTSGFYQYGFNSVFTSALYGQNFSNFNLGGLESILATNIGNFSFGAAYGGDDKFKGSVYSLGYNLSVVRPEWSNAHNLNIRYEKRDSDFIQTWESNPARIKNLYAINYGLPIMRRLTLGLGGNYGQKNDQGEVDKYGYDLSLTMRILSNINATLYAARNRDEFRNTNELAYMMVNITFPDRSQYLTAYADVVNQSRRLTYVKDNLNELNSFKGQATVEDNKTSNVGDADIVFNSKLADLGVHATGFKEKSGESYGRYSARVNSSLVFAGSSEGWSWAISRPVQTSFALLTPNEHLKDQAFGVKSTSPYNEGLSDFMGKAVFVNLLPYQYREIQLDPAAVDIGYSLGKENYVLFPTYRSAHLLFVGAPGTVTVKGMLVSAGEIQPLSTGEIVGDKIKTLFFTNRRGNFLIENLVPGTYVLKTTDERTVTFTIPDNARGLFDLGNLEIAPWVE